MKIFKPDFLSHSTEKHKIPIYSISINPKNDKIATGAQGKFMVDSFDFKIKIWNFKSVKEYGISPTDDHLLSILEIHDGKLWLTRCGFMC
jgi:WD40 repeat protein